MNKISPRIAGVDEAGRGPLVGSVLAAAVILDPERPILGLKDSKKLSATQREKLYLEITTKALAWSVAEASAVEIDEINILQATMLAMQRAIEGLQIKPDEVLVDGNRCPKLSYPVQAIIKGDQKVAAISAASILAKVTRDRLMIELDKIYPTYNFAKHKGYPTAEHIAALKAFGPCAEHRKSFGPVAELICISE